MTTKFRRKVFIGSRVLISANFGIMLASVIGMIWGLGDVVLEKIALTSLVVML